MARTPPHTEDEAANPLAGVGEPPPDESPPLPRQTPAPPAPAVPVLVPRWVQLVVLPLAIVGAYGIVRAAGPVVLLFTVAGLIALVLNPIVSLLQRARFPRGLAVALTILTLLALLTGVGFLLAEPVSSQVSAIQDKVPGWVRGANKALASVQEWLDRNGIRIQIKQQGQTALQTLGDRLTTGSGDLLSFTRDALTTIVEGGIAVVLTLVLTVYMLLYGQRIGAVARRLVPQGDGSLDDDFPTRIQAALFGYVRGQFLFSLIMGTSAGVLLWVLGSLGIFPLGQTYAFFFGAWYGFAELIPYIGPLLGGFPPVVGALFSSHPLDALWLVIAFIVLQQLEGHVVAPTVFGQALRINPLLVIFTLLLGGELYGFVGAFIALPIAAVVRESVVYFRRHLAFEPWDLPGVARRSPAKPASPASGTCPECGAPHSAGAETCPACGTELGEPDSQAAATSAAPGCSHTRCASGPRSLGSRSTCAAAIGRRRRWPASSPTWGRSTRPARCPSGWHARWATRA
jgi:predicted PurR-regulated permease PerM